MDRSTFPRGALGRSIGVAGAAIVLVIGGCKATPRQSAILASSELEISAGELRARTYASGRLLALGIEEAADSVLATTTDSDTRRNALLWKTSAIPALQEATLAPDPLIAAMDLYAYVIQTTVYFESGDGARMFGTEHEIVLASLPRMTASARAFAEAVAGERGADVKVENVVAWSHAHPIRGTRFIRPSLLGSWAEAFGSGGVGALATLGHMDQRVEEMGERLQFINETMLKQVRWNVELMASDVVLPEDLATARSLLARTNDLMGRLPDLISSERAALLGAVTAERVALLRDINEQREATLVEVRAERSTVIAAFHAERLATIAALDSIVRSALLQSNHVIDHFFWRLTQLVAVMVVVAALGLLLVRRRSNPTTGRA